MKKSLILLFAAVIAFGASAMAQKTIKLGHINSSELMQIMPGKDSAQAAFEAEVKILEGELTAMQEELQKKYTDYQERKSQMTELIRSTKEQELNDLNQRITVYQQNAQQKLQEKEKELLQPIIDRAKQAISDVAKENGYTYIFDSSAGTLLYQQDSDDIFSLVKKKLGLK
ncbi:MAG: OmpH family outer membrane protein [Bacteroidales bacterium]|nr:OmpH family outer membrane protein [Bacteroidales bacterium]